MTFRFPRTALLLAAVLSLVAGLAAAHDSASDKAAAPRKEFVEGRDYIVIDPPVQTRSGKQIEVVEVFGYSCPHCANFAPYITRWSKEQKPDVKLEFVPAAFGGIWDAYARVYYTAVTMGVADLTHDALFEALHVERIQVRNIEDIADFYAGHGVDKTQFLSTIESFPVGDKVSDARQRVLAYGVDGTPTLIVAGKYRVLAPREGGFSRLLEIVDFLVEKEREERALPVR
jgi:thiol:disulfide interchange protein DsbA